MFAFNTGARTAKPLARNSSSPIRKDRYRSPRQAQPRCAREGRRIFRSTLCARSTLIAASPLRPGYRSAAVSIPPPLLLGDPPMPCAREPRRISSSRDPAPRRAPGPRSTPQFQPGGFGPNIGSNARLRGERWQTRAGGEDPHQQRGRHRRPPYRYQLQEVAGRSRLCATGMAGRGAEVGLAVDGSQLDGPRGLAKGRMNTAPELTSWTPTGMRAAVS